MNETENPLSVNEAAAFLKLKVSTVYNLVFFGKLTAYKPGGKRLIFKLSDLERYAFSHSVGSRAARAEAVLAAAQKRKPRKKMA